MDNESLEEELQIMEERAQTRLPLSEETFEQPIEELLGSGAVKLDAAATIGDAIRVMQDGRFGAVPVTRDGKLVGIVTERDLLMKVAGKPGDHDRRPVTEIMTPNPDSLMRSDPVKFALNRMHVGGYRHVPIVNDDNEPTHVVSLRDVLSFLISHFETTVVNIPSEPFRGPSNRYSG